MPRTSPLCICPSLRALAFFLALVSRISADLLAPRLEGLRTSRLPSVSRSPSIQRLSVQKESVMMLDLDRTCILGQDANDLGVALQWMDKPQETVDALYKNVVNPVLRPAYDEMKQDARDLTVVIYTRRPTLVNYVSCAGRGKIPLKFCQTMPDGQLCVPSHVRTGDEMMSFYNGPSLLPEEICDTSLALQRLISARDAVAENLGLSSPPQVVVTASQKDVERTTEQLGLRKDNAFLFDDNWEIWQNPKVIGVDAFVALPAENAEKLTRFLDQELPANQLDPELLEFLLEAQPSDRAIEWDRTAATWQWRIPVAQSPLNLWRTPSTNQPDNSASMESSPEETLTLRVPLQRQPCAA